MWGVIRFLKELCAYKGKIGRWRLALNCLGSFIGMYLIFFIIAMVLVMIYRESAVPLINGEEFTLFIELMHILWAFLVVFSLIKRTHDLGYPGPVLLLLIIPFLDILVLLVILFKKGTTGPNNYGEDPLAEK